MIQNEKTCSLSTLNNQAVYDARGNGGGEIVPTITGDHQSRITDYTAICVGNGQLHNISMAEQANTLDTMHDQQAVLVPETAHALHSKANLQFREESGMEGCEDAIARNKILRILQETYGTEALLKWGIAVLDSLQQADILQQGMHESSISREAKTWGELDDSALPRPKLVAEWIMRDLREQQKCGRSSQRWKSSEQQQREPSETLQKLPYKSSQASKCLLDMWKTGKRLGLLQQALHQIQEIRESALGERSGGGDAVTSVVRRLTPLE